MFTYIEKISPQRIAFISILIGSILRLLFPFDIEFKYDQKLMLDWVLEFQNKGSFREIGMMSGGGVYNFGLGVWLFYLLGYISNTPVGLTMVVSVINVISLGLMFWFIQTKIKDTSEKDTWFYALSLMSISIIPFVCSRNIWIQSILPPFSIAIWILYYSRSRKFLSTFTLSFLLVLIGQIHLSGLFLCFVMSGFIAYFHFKNIREVHLFGYIVGGLIAALPMIPLFVDMIQNPQLNPSSSWDNMKDVRILWFHLFDGLGLDVFYTLENSTWLFFKYPSILGFNTYLVGFCYLSILLLSIYYLIKFLISLLQIRFSFNLKAIDISSFTAQFLWICFFTYAMIYFIKIRIFSHYWIITFPFIYLLCIKLFKSNKISIVALILLNLIMTICFVFFIHQTGGLEDSYYGLTYERVYGRR
jgi:hypothetical protein